MFRVPHIRSRYSVIFWSAVCSCACTTNLSSLADGNDDDAAAAPSAKPDAGNDFPPAQQPPDQQQPPDKIVEPNTAFALTLLHGVVDSPFVFFCFADATGTLSGSPLPEGGLAYGKALVVTQVDGLNLTSDAFQPFVIAAEGDLPVGKDCQTLAAEAASFTPVQGVDPEADASVGDAASNGATFPRDAASSSVTTDSGVVDAAPPAPPPLRMQGLPIVPKGTLSAYGSYLLTATGCVGGPSSAAPTEQLACGANYSPSRPTLTAMLVRLSQIADFNGPALQFLQASVATNVSSLSSVPGPATDGMAVTIVSDVIGGAIAPYPPLRSVPLSTFGSPFAQVELEVKGTSDATWREPWGTALDLAGLTTLENGAGYTLVLLGPNPSLKAPGFWNEPLLSLVRNAPSTQ